MKKITIMTTINKDNFHIATKAVFTELTEEIPNRNPDYVSKKKMIIWEHEIGDDFYPIENDGGEIIAFGEYSWDVDEGDSPEVYNVAGKFIGKYGDTGYIVEYGTSSEYWYSEQGVIRHSDHWGNVAKCIWEKEPIDSSFGFCKWENFLVLDESLYIKS